MESERQLCERYETELAEIAADPAPENWTI